MYARQKERNRTKFHWFFIVDEPVTSPCATGSKLFQ
jgi:hypothetical protein